MRRSPLSAPQFCRPLTGRFAVPVSLGLIGLIASVQPSEAQRPRIPGAGYPAVKVETKTLEGTIEAISPQGLVVNIDGQSGPVPMDRQTTLEVTGYGDPGFMQPGAAVWVMGRMQPDGSVSNAQFTIHLSPQETLKTGERTFEASDPSIGFAGRIVSLEPFVVQSLDTIVPEMANPQGGPAKRGRALRNPRLQVKPEIRQPERVRVIFGPNPALAAVGDEARITIRSDRPNVASRVQITKEETATSPATRAEAAKSDGAMKGKAKKDAAKADEKSDEKADDAAE